MRKKAARFWMISCCVLALDARTPAWADDCEVTKSETVENIEQQAFEVAGKHCASVSQNVEKLGPPHFESSPPSPSYCLGGNGRITKARVVLEGTIHAPKWTDEASAPAKYQAFIKTYLAAIKAHEDRHAAIYRKHFQNLHTKLIGKTPDEAAALIKKLGCDEAKDHLALDKKEGKLTVNWAAGPDVCTQIVSGRDRPEYLDACK